MNNDPYKLPWSDWMSGKDWHGSGKDHTVPPPNQDEDEDEDE